MQGKGIQNYISEVKGSGDRNLYKHLSDVLAKILLDNPENSFDVFEDYSHYVKQMNYDYKKIDQQLDNAERLREKNGELSGYIEKAKKQLEKLNDGGEEAAEVGAIGFVPNFMDESKWFEQAGIGFGTEESFRIFKSLSALAFRKQAKQVRLWGKIFGSQHDYWIAEGVVESAGDEGDLAPNVEPKGAKGVNKLNYWVVNNLLDDWTELPIVTPEQIIISRRIKKMFTGRLDADVITNPHFDGKEKHLLKCQIVRITAASTIIPAGLFVVNADDPREIEPPEEEKKLPDFDTLSKLNSWVHHSENILLEGRVTHLKPDNLPEDVDEEKFMAEKVAQDPFEPRLKPINLDNAPEGYKQAWTIKTFGDQTNYTLFQKEAGQVNYGYIAIRNIYWPGWITLYYIKKKQQWQYLYVGYGFKQSNTLYYPQEPEQVWEEQPDIVGVSEPNFPAEVEQVQVGGQDVKDEEDEG